MDFGKSLSLSVPPRLPFIDEAANTPIHLCLVRLSLYWVKGLDALSTKGKAFLMYCIRKNTNKIAYFTFFMLRHPVHLTSFEDRWLVVKLSGICPLSAELGEV